MLNKGQKQRRKKSLATSLEVDTSPGSLAVREEVEIEEAEFADSLPVDRAGFVSARDRIRKLTSDFKSFCHCNESDKQLALLGQMQEQIKSIRGVFLGADLALWAKFCSSVSTLLFATARKPGFLTFSSPRTLSNALSLIKEVVVGGPGSGGMDGTPLRALIVDEDNDGRRALAVALLNQGLRITECDDFQQAQMCLQENSFDVMLSDSGMAGMEDPTNSSECREFLEELSLPVILLTGRPDFGTTEGEALPEGCDFIAKPIAPTEVIVKAFAFALQYRLESEENPPEPVKPAAAREPKRLAPSALPLALPTALAELTRERELRKAAEQKLAEVREANERIEQELSKGAARPQQLQERIAALEEKLQNAHAETEEAQQREAQAQQKQDAFEQQLSALNRTLGQTRQEMSQEKERRLAAEMLSAQMTQSRAKLEHELAVNASQPRKAEERNAALEKIQQSLSSELDSAMRREAKLQKELASRSQQVQEALDQAAELEKKQQSLSAELRGALQRETRFKKQLTDIEKRLQSLEETLTQTQAELVQENHHRLAAEQQAAQTIKKLHDITKKEQSIRQQLEQMTKEHADEMTQSQAALRKETTARQAAERTAADLSTTHVRLEKKLTESTSQAARAHERIETLENLQKSVQIELRDLLERRRELHQQGAALDHQLEALSRAMKQG